MRSNGRNRKEERKKERCREKEGRKEKRKEERKIKDKNQERFSFWSLENQDWFSLKSSRLFFGTLAFSIKNFALQEECPPDCTVQGFAAKLIRTCSILVMIQPSKLFAIYLTRTQLLDSHQAKQSKAKQAEWTWLDEASYSVLRTDPWRWWSEKVNGREGEMGAPQLCIHKLEGFQHDNTDMPQLENTSHEFDPGRNRTRDL